MSDRRSCAPRAWWPIAFVGLAVAAPGAAAQAPVPTAAQAPLRLEEALPADPDVLTGSLLNGMAFYIRKNGRPEKRVSLRLAVKAGSLFEADDQQGLAHFGEHMAFKGSAHFKPGELVSYLESIGARFGSDTNAYTQMESTVYTLDVPTDKEGLVEKGLLALGDFAARSTLDSAEIEKERGVLVEEWRLRQGAGQRIRDVQMPVLFHGSRYAERLPIGKVDVLRTAPPARLRAFVRDFYRPDRMAIVALGDVEPAQVEAQLRRLFADIPATTDERPLPEYDVPPHAETLVSVAVDKEAQASGVSVIYKAPRTYPKTVGEFRLELPGLLASFILNERFSDLARRPDAPFLGAGASPGNLSRSVEQFSLGATVADGGMATGLRALLVEAERFRRYGPNADELDRTRKNMLAYLESAVQNKDKRESPHLAAACLDHFLEQGLLTSPDDDYRLFQQLLPTVGLAEIRDQAKTLLHEGNRVVLAQAPEKAGPTLPDEAALRRVMADVAKLEVTPWVSSTPQRGLVATKPAPGRVVGRRAIEPLGVTVLTLANGVEVWLKPTDFKNNEVLISAYALGGASLAEPADLFEARYAPDYVGEAGIGGLTPVEMEKLLAGKLAGGQPYVTDYTHGLSGGCRPEDCETALQLAYVALTQPNDRPEAFETLRKRVAASLANRATDPDAAFQDKQAAVISQDHYLWRALRPEDVPGLRPSVALSFFRQRFANAADFTFFVVGAFEIEKMTPLIETYLGGLPSTGKRTSRFLDRALRFPEGVSSAEVRKGSEPRSATALTFFADTGLDPTEVRRANAAASVLTTRLRETLRDLLSGTYSVSAYYSDQGPLRGFGTMGVRFGSDPERAAALAEAALAEVAKLRDDGPTEQDVAKEQEIERRELETNLRQNRYWLGSLLGMHQRGLDPLLILKRREQIDALSVAALHETFRRYFPMDRRTQVTLMPAAAK
jgi:zinc protease